MSDIQVRPIRTAAERRTFLHFPWRIYRRDPLWVPPLLPERAARTDPKKGVFFKRGIAEFFIAWRGREPVGTICAAEDRQFRAGRRHYLLKYGSVEKHASSHQAQRRYPRNLSVRSYRLLRILYSAGIVNRSIPHHPA